MDLAHHETTSRNIVHNHKKYLINFEGSTLTKLNVILKYRDQINILAIIKFVAVIIYFFKKENKRRNENL